MTSIDPSQVGSLFKEAAKNAGALAENSETITAVSEAVSILTQTYLGGGALFAAGNGGSAADAQHIVAEMVCKLDRDRTPLKAFTLSADTSILTAVGNDFSYDDIFARQVRANMTDKDVLLAITTSGNSRNILKAIETAKGKGAKTVLLSGRSGGEAGSMCDLSILAPGENTGAIQENHTIIYHAICSLTEKALAEKGFVQYV